MVISHQWWAPLQSEWYLNSSQFTRLCLSNCSSWWKWAQIVDKYHKYSKSPPTNLGEENDKEEERNKEKKKCCPPWFNVHFSDPTKQPLDLRTSQPYILWGPWSVHMIYSDSSAHLQTPSGHIHNLVCMLMHLYLCVCEREREVCIWWASI